MPTQQETYAEDRTSTRQLAIALGAVSLAIAGGVGIALAARRASRSRTALDELGFRLGDEQATTIRAPLEAVEAAWIEWCVSGRARVTNAYAIRFEPAPAARGTEVRLSGGGSAFTLRDELRRFKQVLEAGEISISDSPGLSRPARPRDSAEISRLAEVL
jgi:uncharacterized membrane protein